MLDNCYMFKSCSRRFGLGIMEKILSEMIKYTTMSPNFNKILCWVGR